MTSRRYGCWARSASRSTLRPGSGTTAHRRRSLSDCRHLVADRDRRHHDLAAARDHYHQAGSATNPIPGIYADVVDDQGNPVPLGEGGYLVLKQPWPAMLRGIYGDPERYKATYWSKFPGHLLPGDGGNATRTATTGCWAASTMS